MRHMDQRRALMLTLIAIATVAAAAACGSSGGKPAARAAHAKSMAFGLGRHVLEHLHPLRHFLDVGMPVGAGTDHLQRRAGSVSPPGPEKTRPVGLERLRRSVGARSPTGHATRPPRMDGAACPALRPGACG